MKTTAFDVNELSSLTGNVPERTPIVMLNLLRYREVAVYSKGSHPVPVSGREAYFGRYLPAFGQVAAQSDRTKGIVPIFIGNAVSVLVGPQDEPWDDVALIEYPDMAAFRQVVESESYKRDADPHREAALENWRLIALLKQAIPASPQD